MTAEGTPSHRLFIARLLWQPGLELHALDLVAKASGDGGNPPFGLGNRVGRAGSAAEHARLNVIRASRPRSGPRPLPA
jgi:hypothetical protein